MNVSRVEFGSMLSYAPHGISKKAEEAKTVMRSLKNDMETRPGIMMSEYLAGMMKKHIREFPFADYFHPNVVLVPTPKNSPLKPGTLWVPERITRELVRNGLGRSTEACLERMVTVARSTGQKIGANRPKAFQHFESMRVRDYRSSPRRSYWWTT